MKSSFILVISLLSFFALSHSQKTYQVKVASFDADPVISFLQKTSAFQQSFNPSWIQSAPNQPRSGLLVRSQNCSSTPGGNCVRCNPGHPSVLSFAQMMKGEPNPSFMIPSNATVVFEPQSSLDNLGTEDPRIAYVNGTYYMFYTSYGSQGVYLSLATSTDPTNRNLWKRHGPVFPDKNGSKSGALLARSTPPHFLYWGDNSITLATSSDLLTWKNEKTFISPRSDHFDSSLVESGPPPLPLSTGDYLFFYNSADKSLAYHPGWIILSGQDPTQIIARSSSPLLSPDAPWAKGTSPWTCNVPNVIFLEAAYAISGQKDLFRVYFGGADAVIGTATIQVTLE